MLVHMIYMNDVDVDKWYDYKYLREMRNYRNYTTNPESTNIVAQQTVLQNWIPE